MKPIDKKTYIFFLLIIFISSAYIKFFNTSLVFSEYDDIGVATLFKGFLGEKIFNLNFLFFEKKIILDKNFFSNFENSIFLPAYIFWYWTYPPLQYVFYLFFDIYNQTIGTKIFLIRLPSIIFSLLAMVCFLIIMNKLKFKKVTKLISICLLAYSFNVNIYSNHAAPYSAYIFSGFFGLLNLLNYIKKDYSKKYLLFNNISLYLSYSNIIIFLGFLFIEFRNKNIIKFFKEFFTKYKLFLLLNLLIILPIIIKFLFSNHTTNMLYRSDYTQENLFWINEFILNIYLGTKFILVGFIDDTFFVFFITLLFFLSLIMFIKKKFKFNILSKCSFLFIFFWFTLFFFQILPYGESRHSLILLPFFLMILSDLVENIIPNKKLILLPLLLLIVHSSLSNIELLKSKNSLFNFQVLKDSKLDIYSYGYTLEPFLLNKIKNQIYNTDLSSFLNNEKLLVNTNKEIYLVSTLETLSNKFKRKNKFFDLLKDNYKIEVIEEITTKITHSHNNNCCYYSEDMFWGQNNFYLYKLIQK
jgi:hypothetical protein